MIVKVKPLPGYQTVAHLQQCPFKPDRDSWSVSKQPQPDASFPPLLRQICCSETSGLERESGGGREPVMVSLIWLLGSCVAARHRESCKVNRLYAVLHFSDLGDDCCMMRERGRFVVNVCSHVENVVHETVMTELDFSPKCE